MEARLSRLSRELERATQTAARLPSSTDLDFYCTIDPALQDALTDARGGLGELLVGMHRWIGEEGAAARADAAQATADPLIAPAAFASAVGDQVDRLLERADVYLDQLSGRREVSWDAAAGGRPQRARADEACTDGLPASGPLPAHVLDAPILPPQRRFTTQPDNREDTVWSRPLRFGKPHAVVPPGWTDPSWDLSPGATTQGQYGVEGDPRLNPYHKEIFAADVPTTALVVSEPKAPGPLDLAAPEGATAACSFEWVSTASALAALLAHLEEARVAEIAVDLEHHSTHSYQGIVCLMQISTRWGDWIVDTLSDEVRENAERLNAVFADPNKVLVLHGADHDILWLQRDLGLYVTNLFDTYHATNVLAFGAHGLAYLLARYCAFDADKRFQLADWRIRPLPREMLFYARSDTHSLLYVYDRLRQELLQQGGVRAVREVFERSRATATKAYVKKPWDPEGESSGGWRALWLRRGGDLARASPDAKPLALMGREERLTRRLHRWRDSVARAEDESVPSILSAANLIRLAFRAPATPEEARRAVPPTAHAVRSRATELASVIHAELDAWQADASLRDRAAAAQLDAAVAEAPEDTGVSVRAAASHTDTPVSARTAPSYGSASPARVCPEIWDIPADSLSSSGSVLFGNLVSARDRPQADRRARGAKAKRTSLFELPAALTPPAGAPASIMRKIRNECRDVLQGLFGGGGGAGTRERTRNEMARLMGVAHVVEGHSAGHSEGHDVGGDTVRDGSGGRGGWKAEDHAVEPEDPVDDTTGAASRGAARGEATVSPPPSDPVVAVSKKTRWSKERKRKRQTGEHVEPFEYDTAASVLDLRPARDGTHAQRGERGGRPMFKAAKRKNDMRSGNRSGTFR
ncbi:exosome nuclease subunit [Malassezia sp. CBS 17886]|nr:exosome nuclease subunit [Malassezia sp. CBS 17886]